MQAVTPRSLSAKLAIVMDQWVVHRLVKQWNTHVDWFTATIVSMLVALILATRELSWVSVAEVSGDFATVTAVYLGIAALHNANRSSKLLMLLIALFIAAGVSRFFGLLPIEGVKALLFTGVVVTMIFLYKLSRRRCRQAWCVDFIDKHVDDACKVCGLRERRYHDEPHTRERRKALW
jgi:hypothetical protein